MYDLTVHGLDAAFVGALVLCESGGDPGCISPSPAQRGHPQRGQYESFHCG